MSCDNAEPALHFGGRIFVPSSIPVCDVCSGFPRSAIRQYPTPELNCFKFFFPGVAVIRSSVSAALGLDNCSS